MRLFSLRNTVAAGAFGLFALMSNANAQNVNEEYREYQRAQRQAQEEYQDYLRDRTRANYRDWQQAQRRARQEYREYVRSNRGYRNNGNRNYGYDNRTYGNRNYGYGNRTYGNNTSTVYDNRTGQYYRVIRDGSYYQTDQRGVELLRQAVNSGYQQGYRQGQMDRQYGRGGDYYGNNVYRNGTYGYQSHVDRSQYQYYFQQGFERGYQDGFNSRTQYGYRSGNSYNILGTILSSILQIAR